MDGNDKKLIDILKSIDESLKIIAGRKQLNQPESVKKTYRDFYFAQTEKGWKEKKEHDNETNT